MARVLVVGRRVVGWEEEPGTAFAPEPLNAFTHSSTSLLHSLSFCAPPPPPLPVTPRTHLKLELSSVTKDMGPMPMAPPVPPCATQHATQAAAGKRGVREG